MILSWCWADGRLKIADTQTWFNCLQSLQLILNNGPGNGLWTSVVVTCCYCYYHSDETLLKKPRDVLMGSLQSAAEERCLWTCHFEAQEVAQTHRAVGIAAPNEEDLPQRLVLHFLPGDREIHRSRCWPWKNVDGKIARKAETMGFSHEIFGAFQVKWKVSLQSIQE